MKNLTVEENLTVASRIPTGAPFDLERIYQMFPRLEERAGQNAGALSGGEQQMLAIARALLTNPRVVLCDEPSKGLAPRIVEEVGVTLQKLKGEGLSVLLVEQNTTLALALADRVAILNTGRLAFDGSVAEVTADPDILIAIWGSIEQSACKGTRRRRWLRSAHPQCVFHWPWPRRRTA